MSDTDVKTLTLDGIPDRVSRTTICQFLESLGIDPNRVLRDPGFVIGSRNIECSVKALDADGQLYVNDRNELAVHTVSIPIVWDDETG